MAEWPMVKLGELGHWTSGGTPKRSVTSYFDGPVPWASIADLNDGVISNTAETLSIAGLKSSSAKLYPAGSILVAMYGSIGKLATTSREMASSQAIAAFNPYEEILDRTYTTQVLLYYRPKLQSLGKGGTQKNISQAVLKDFSIPLPPLEEQRRVAQVLTISSRNVALAKETSAQVLGAATAFMKQVVGSSNSNQPLEAFASIRGGSTPSKANPEFWNGSIPWFSSKDLKHPTLSDSIDHVTEQALEQTSLKSITSPGIAVSTRGMSLAHTLPTSIIPTGSCVNQDLKVFLPNDQEDLKFLYYALRVRESEILAKVASSAHGTKRLDVKHLKQVPVPVLSAAERAEVNEQIAAIESLHQFALDKSDKLQELHRSLATRAFAGEL